MALTERLALLITANADEALLSFDRLGRKMAVTEAAAKKRGLGIGAAFTGGAVLAGFALGEMVKKGVEALAVQQRIDLQTQAVLKSTGSVAGVTAKQVAGLAEEISHYSEFSIDAVKASENVLLSFTAVRDSAGAGNDIFDRATKAAADLSARFGTDLPTAARQLGRALQDPAAGMNALARSGVAFDAGTKEQIKSLAKQGQLLEAQKLLLDAVDQKVAGAARAGGAAASGGLAQLRNSFEEIDKTLAGPLLAPLTTGLHDLARAAQVVNEHPVALKTFEGIVGVGSAAIIASKAIGIFGRIRDSELAKTLRSTEAHNANAAAIEREGLAANSTAGALARLGTAEVGAGEAGAGGALVGGAATGGLLSRFLGPVALGVTAGEVGSHLLFGKGLESLPGQVHAHALGEQLNNVISRYNQGQFTFGQDRALEGLNSQVIDARTAAAKGDYSQLQGALSAVNKALKDNADIYNQAALSAREYAENTSIAYEAAKKSYSDLVAADATARQQMAQHAAQESAFADVPNKSGAADAKVAELRLAARTATDAVTAAEHRLERLSGSRTQAVVAAEAALGRAKTLSQVASAEARLQRLRATGGAAANTYADAENALARAKERAALANAKVTAAEQKAGEAQGFSGQQLLAKEQANVADARSKAKAAAILVKAGLSQDVLSDLINNVEKNAPGTLVKLAQSFTPAIIRGLNANRTALNQAAVALAGAPLDAAERVARIKAAQAGQKDAQAYIDAWKAQFEATPLTLRPPVQGPINPATGLRGSAAPGLYGPFNPATGRGSAVSNTFNFTGPIVTPDPAKLIKEAQDLARLKALGGVLNVAGIL